MLIRLVEVFVVLVTIYDLVRRVRMTWRSLMEWDRDRELERDHMIVAAWERRRYQRHPWLRTADVHERRAAAIRAELRALYERAARRGSVPRRAPRIRRRRAQPAAKPPRTPRP